MKKPIGIFDSGVGGLTVYKSIRDNFPEEDLVYFGDTARVPYGPKSPNTIIEYSIQNARFLLQQNIKVLIVACNTSSAVAIPYLQKLTDIPIIGVIEPGAEQAVISSKNHRIGVIGTEGTIRSNAYTKAITEMIPKAKVYSHPCPLFVPLAEEGWHEHAVAFDIAEQYLSFFHGKDIDTLVLGCTHYPLLKETIQKVVGDKVQLVDSAEAISDYLKRFLPEDSDGQPGTNVFYVSDNEEKFSEIASRILLQELTILKRVKLFESWFIDR
ncbi:MAG: glutamate racemase [Candidatus Cloacimonetes bacterium HGW-Cloacimonetes-1]|jgi:glutamate racemase|nr:MAG: glutamate racemase [Candidatus Cloacimonetes bacterium HGW-Cloacimonetes-1]